MQFKQGTKVYTTDDKDIGSVDRVVLNPKTKEVTHLIVRKGFLLSEDKIIPLALIASANEDRVTLRGSTTDLDSLLPFEETHFVPLDETDVQMAAYPIGFAAPFYLYEPMGSSMFYPDLAAAYANEKPYGAETQKNIPEDSIALREGARVITADGQDVGSVKRIFTQPENDRATQLLISNGVIFKEQKMIPVGWIEDIQEDEIHLNVSTAMLKGLPEFQEI